MSDKQVICFSERNIIIGKAGQKDPEVQFPHNNFKNVKDALNWAEVLHSTKINSRVTAYLCRDSHPTNDPDTDFYQPEKSKYLSIIIHDSGYDRFLHLRLSTFNSIYKWTLTAAGRQIVRLADKTFKDKYKE